MRELYCKKFSDQLGRDMEYLVFCTDDPDDRTHGKVCLAFPSQNGQYYDFRNFGLVESARHWIDSGQLYMICPSVIDAETWSASGDPRARIELQELWYHYIVDELLPDYTENTGRAMTIGVSMGGSHAANFFFRRPDLFDSMISLSGIYNAQYFFGDYCDDLVYGNSPVHFLPNMPQDHPWIELYRKSHIIFCCGQSADERDMVSNTRDLDLILSKKNIDHWADYWGYDVNHDWVWWRRQLPYFLDHLSQLGAI